MADVSAAERARMACRVYLKLYDAGPAGAPVTKDDALGPRDDPDAGLEAALAVISRFMDDTILDEPGHAGGVPHYALTAGMRGRMQEADGGRPPLVDRLRSDLAKADRGEDAPGAGWAEAEAMIRTGQAGAAPL